MLTVVEDTHATTEDTSSGGSLLDRIVRDGARQMLAAALRAEVAAYIDAHAGEVDEAGRRLVVRNGYHQAREVTTAAGAVPVRAPRVNDRGVDETGQRRRFSSAILPAWARKSPQVAEVLPLLYLHGFQDQASRAAREDLHDARPEPLPARHRLWAATHRRRRGPPREPPGRQVAATQLRPLADRRGHRRRLHGKHLLEVERGWRDIKTHLDLRPVHHRKEERIRAHVLLCWLALLLIRIAENEIPTHTWRRLREELQTLHVGQFTGNAGHVHQRTELTPAQRDILRALQVAEPPRFLQLTTAD